MNIAPPFIALKQRHRILSVLSVFALLCAAVLMASGQIAAGNKSQSTQGNVDQIRKSAEGGDAKAQYALSKMYSEGKGVSKDQQEAARWARKSAEQGHVPGQNTLAYLYLVGEGVPQDLKQSILWLEKAAEQNDLDAQTNLGQEYAMGLQLTKAYMWSTVAAQNGSDVGAENRDQLRRFISPSQAEDAQREAREWWLAHPQFKPKVKPKS
ncbi:MAG: tetratricopeptide repeat protein [Candidatus Korobacteraceae bacterium]|jgi:TPR repeat protein